MTSARRLRRLRGNNLRFSLRPQDPRLELIVCLAIVAQRQSRALHGAMQRRLFARGHGANAATGESAGADDAFALLHQHLVRPAGIRGQKQILGVRGLHFHGSHGHVRLIG